MNKHLRRITYWIIGLSIPLLALNAPAATEKQVGINVLLKRAITPAILTDLGKYGTVRDAVYEIKAVTLRSTMSALPKIRALPYVSTANPDAVRNGSPVDTVDAPNFANGHSTWDQDAINATISPATNARAVPFDGSGVYVAVIDTGLTDSWRQYFPQERIAEEYAKAFRGGGASGNGNISEPPNLWEHDANSHGTHVTSTILGFQLLSSTAPNRFNGAAPKSTVIPIKVLGQNGSGWSSVVARGITYVGSLKAGPLAGSPVVINMSLGGPNLDAMEKAAIDYAIDQGVIIVASAGNSGEFGMGYPGAYAPVISVAASGWKGQWKPGADGIVTNWWWADDVSEPTRPAQFYIANFSSREKPGQDLDVVAPGVWVVGPYNVNNGQLSYFYLSGTSMASPHVAGIAALMAQKNPNLTAAEAETYLTESAIPMPAGSRTVLLPGGATTTYEWDDDATGSGLATATAPLARTP